MVDWKHPLKGLCIIMKCNYQLIRARALDHLQNAALLIPNTLYQQLAPLLSSSKPEVLNTDFKFWCLLLVNLTKIVVVVGLEADSGETRKPNSFLSGPLCYRALLLLFLAHLERGQRRRTNVTPRNNLFYVSYPAKDALVLQMEPFDNHWYLNLVKLNLWC